MGLLRSAFSHFVSQILVSFLGFVATVYFARELGAAILGQYFVIVAILGWLNIPANGVNNAITKRISEGNQQGGFFSTGFVMNLALAMLWSLGIFVFAGAVNDYIGSPVSGLLAALVVSQTVFSTMRAGLQGQGKVGREGFTMVVNRLFRLVGQVVLVTVGFGLVGLAVGHASAFVAAGTLAWLMYDIAPRRPTLKRARGLLSFASYSWIGRLRGQVFGWMDTILLNFFVGSALVGVYEIAWGLTSFLFLVSVSLNSTLFPEMSKLAEQNNVDRIQALLADAMVFSGIFMIPGLFGAAALSSEILRIYGSEFVQGGTVLLILIVARAIGGYGRQLVNAINALDRPDIAFWINVALIGSNAILNVVLIWTIGWEGAAIATAVSALLMLTAAYVKIADLIGRPAIPKDIGIEFVAAAIMWLCLQWLSEVVPGTGALRTVGLVVVGATIYMVLVTLASTLIREKFKALFAELVAVL